MILRRDLAKYELLGWREIRNKNPFLSDRDLQKYATVLRSRTAGGNEKMMAAENKFLSLQKWIHPTKGLIVFYVVASLLFALYTALNACRLIGVTGGLFTFFDGIDVFLKAGAPHDLAAAAQIVVCVFVYVFFLMFFVSKKKRSIVKEKAVLKEARKELFALKQSYRNEKIIEANKKYSDINKIKLP